MSEQPALSLSVVIPVYRSRDSLPELTAELARVLPALASDYEVIFVNDGSPDDSWQVVQLLAAKYPFVQGISLMRNYGQHNALLCGIRAAHHDIICTMDDDLQHPPETIATLLTRLHQGFDVVYGAPSAEQHGLLRDLASQLTKFALQGSMGVENARKVSAFRVFRAELRAAFAEYSSSYVNLDVLLTWASNRFSYVTVPFAPRKYGQSNYTLRKLITHAINMITGFSTLPLQLASLLGFALALFGVLILVYVVGRALFSGIVVPGFAFLASIVAIFSGAQLFALGIIGEYLARMHFRMMDRPTYTVRVTTDTAPPPSGVAVTELEQP